MLDNFITHNATKVYFVAGVVSQCFRNQVIDSRHMLFAINDLKDCTDSKILAYLGVDAAELQTRIFKDLEESAESNDKLDFVENNENYLYQPPHEFDRKKSTSDILIEMLSDQHSRAYRILIDLEVTVDRVKEALSSGEFQSKIGEMPDQPDSTLSYFPPHSDIELQIQTYFKTSARNAIYRAIKSARESGHREIGILHLLYGLLTSKHSTVISVLKNKQVNLGLMIEDLTQKLKDLNISTEQGLNECFTEQVLKIMTSIEAVSRNHNIISEQDLLVEIIRNDSDAADLLSKYGINYFMVMESLIKMISGTLEWGLGGWITAHQDFSLPLQEIMIVAIKEFKKRKDDHILLEHLLLGLLQLPDSKISRYLKEKGITIDDINELLDYDEES